GGGRSPQREPPSADAPARLGQGWQELKKTLAPAAWFGVETALLDVLGRASGESMAGLVCSHRRGPRPAGAGNGVGGMAELEEAADAARAAVAAGFGCVKLKVGVGRDASAEVARIAAVRAAIGPETRLRLDANGVWSRAQAVEVLARASAYDI